METKPGNYSDLAGKTAVVTSGSHGVGSGICRELGRQGVQVVVNGRDLDAITAVTDAVIASGGAAIGIQADVTDQDQVRGLREQAEDAYGPVDIVCACAGGQGDPISIGELDLDAWRAGIDVNLTSAFLTLREFVPSMARRRSGAVVTMASTAHRIAGRRRLRGRLPGERCVGRGNRRDARPQRRTGHAVTRPNCSSCHAVRRVNI
jgi:3-oxoacyl-[acyl-carrier protein] reductase